MNIYEAAYYKSFESGAYNDYTLILILDSEEEVIKYIKERVPNTDLTKWTILKLDYTEDPCISYINDSY